MKSRFPRTGKTLIEMLVVMVGLSVVLATAGQLLHRLAQAERLVRQSSAVGRAELRLARDFRRDVRTAASANTLEDGLRLTIDGATVMWTVSDDTVRRTTGDGTSQRREGYRLGNVAATFRLDDPRWAVLEIQPRRDNDRPTLTGPFTIVAAVGVDRPNDVATGSPARPTEESAQPVEAPKPVEEGAT